MDSNFDLTAFRQEFLINGEGWGVSDCYKPYDDKFLRRDAQDAYEGAKWAWQHQQAKVEKLQQENLRLAYGNTSYYNQAVKQNEIIDELQKRIDKALKIQDEFDDQDDVRLMMYAVEQALKGEGTPNINIDEKGECRHFSTTMFSNGKAECFHCDAVVNEEREVIGKQKKAVWTVSKVKTFEETWDLNNKKEGDQ